MGWFPKPDPQDHVDLVDEIVKSLQEEPDQWYPYDSVDSEYNWLRHKRTEMYIYVGGGREHCKPSPNIVPGKHMTPVEISNRLKKLLYSVAKPLFDKLVSPYEKEDPAVVLLGQLRDTE
tara:strand:+ start:97 stop:453 length:357 start_codon:yes stop_codon:yes gene_type:complete